MTTTERGLPLEESGQGSTMLLLDWTPWETKALVDSLSSRYRVISVGLPGTAEPAGSAGEVAASVAETADSAGLDSFALVGASLGADVAFPSCASASCISNHPGAGLAPLHRACRPPSLEHPGPGGQRDACTPG